MSDIRRIDPAVADAKPHASERPAPVSVLAQPLLTATLNEETKEYVPAVDAETQVVVKTSDNQRAIVPKAVAAKLPFATSADETEFPFPIFTLQALYQWVEKYGAKGVCASTLPTGANTFIDFSVLTSDEWDKQFYSKYLKKDDDGERFINLINAAEKYGLEGLLTFAVTAFSVELRGESDEFALKMFGQNGKPTAEETAAAAKAYPWFQNLTRPTA